MTVDEIVVAVFVSHLRVWMLLCFLSNELKSIYRLFWL